MCSVRAVQQNNYYCDHDQSERISSKGVGSRLEKLLKTNFIINTFQDFPSHLQNHLHCKSNNWFLYENRLRKSLGLTFVLNVSKVFV